MSDLEDKVVSEVHSFSKDVILIGSRNGAVLSRFDFTYPSDLRCRNINEGLADISYDEDGDIEVRRKADRGVKDDVILIEHQISTSLELVGEQVWRGAFYLSDFILHNWKLFKNSNVLEIASGVGLTSVVAAMISNKVIATDIDQGQILPLLQRNLERNKDLCVAESSVRVLDFYDSETAVALTSEIEDTDFILAADVVYNDKLTEAFFKTIFFLLKQKRVLYVALEKRYVFTIEDLDTVAPCYEYFTAKLESMRNNDTLGVKFQIEQINSNDIPQYFAYERTKELVLWKIAAV